MACPECGGCLSLVATIEQRPVIEKILRHLGFPVEPTSPSAALAVACCARRDPQRRRFALFRVLDAARRAILTSDGGATGQGRMLGALAAAFDIGRYVNSCSHGGYAHVLLGASYVHIGGEFPTFGFFRDRDQVFRHMPLQLN